MADATLPKDEFSATLARFRNHPGVVEKASTVERADFYGNTETWVIRTLRSEGDETVFLIRSSATTSTQVVLPAEVVATITRQHDGINKVVIKRGARKAAATRKALGHVPFTKKVANE